MSDEILQSMTLEQKVGQLLCFGFCGTEPHPDILHVVRDYHVAGFRVTPHARKAIRYLPDGHPGRSHVDRCDDFYQTKPAKRFETKVPSHPQRLL